MRRTSLLLGAILVSGGTVSAQTTSAPAGPFRAATQTALHPAAPVNPTLGLQDQAPAKPATIPESLTAFDNTRVELVWRDWTWKLMADGVVLKEFGRRESEARQALRLVRGLRLTQHGTVGEPPVMEYWLSDGHGPIGFAPGIRPLPVDSASLKVEQQENQWVVRDRQRVWFNFNRRGDEAQQALTVMQKYRFTQAAVLGNPLAPNMMVFTANPAQIGTGAAALKSVHSQPADATAALAGYVPATLPPLAHAATQPNQPAISFSQGPIESLPVRQTASLRAVPPDTPGLTERVSFDWRQAQVRQEHGHWKLEAGSHVLGDFGGNQHAATEALKAVQYYHFTEQCQVGQPTPYCTYFLVGGQAPRGIPFGVQGRPLDVDHMQVQKVGDNYALVTAGQPVLQFGPRPDEARHMFDVIRRQHFDCVCHFGGPEEKGMTFLVQAR